MYIDITYLVMVLPVVIFSLWASWNVKHTYRKYEKQHNARGITGGEAARRLLDANGLRNVPVECVSGTLTDPYTALGAIDAVKDLTWTSNTVYDKTDKVYNFGAKLSIPLLLLGLFLASWSPKLILLAYAGVAL